MRGARAVPLLVALAAGCAGMVEVPVETPLQSKLDVSRFRRILIAGFVTDLEPSDVDLSSETSRLLQNQLRSNTKLQVLEPDRPPLQEALSRVLEKLGEQGRYNKEEKEQFRLEADKLLQDPEFWRKLGEEYQQPLVVTGKLGFEVQDRSGFQPEQRVVRRPTDGPADARPGQPLRGTQGASASTRTSTSSTRRPASSCTRSASPKRCSTPRSSASRRCRPTSS